MLFLHLERILPGAAIRLFLLATITMVAFAANSILNRLALATGSIGPAEFAAIRVTTGVLVLFALLCIRDRALPLLQRPDWIAAAGLAAYMIGFSFAYVALDAGLGALILFGGVQIFMFLGALREGERPSGRRWTGMGLAFGGLIVLCAPREDVALPVVAMGLMTLAAIGWSAYSIAGRAAQDPVRATAWNFAYALPIVLVALAVGSDIQATTYLGIVLAMLSGGVTSALGYALWYRVLPQLGTVRAALAQLTVPAIALLLGGAFLGEVITLEAILACLMIIGGVALGLIPTRNRAGPDTQ